MKQQLRERRDRAAERHDAALASYPTRKGEAFQRELQAVVDELTLIAEAADDLSSDPVEVAKTYRWLGDAYFDLAQGKVEARLTSGAQAYQRSEELLADADAPVEKAKLDFNYGNTLRGLSQGFNVGLLEAAQTRYERALQTFRTYHLPDFAALVQEQLGTIDPQIRLARKQSELNRGYGQMQELEKRLEDANPAERERIARELEDLKKLAGKGDPAGTLAEALEKLNDLVEKYPERYEDPEGKREKLQKRIDDLSSLMKDDLSKQTHTAADGDQEQEIMHALGERLKKKVATGNVSADGGAQLEDLLKRFTDTMSGGGDDLDSMAERAQKMRELTRQSIDAAMSPSWSTPDPEAGSRADRAVTILHSLKRYLVAEKGQGMLPSDESTAGTDLLTRLLKIEARIREAAADDNRVSTLEDEVWRLALEVQEHARRYNLIVAQPDFAISKVHAKPKSLFLSGGEELISKVEELAGHNNFELFDNARRGDPAQERWNQLCSASVAVFDVGVPAGADRAQVCYELGLGLALGKPCVVVARPKQRLPFDINLPPVRISGNRIADVGLLDQAIESALKTVVWGGGEAGLGRGPRDALAWLDRHFHRRLSEGSLRIAMELTESKQDDATAFRRSLDQLLGMLGADAPAALLPAWPPAYPDPASKPRCFHVMPFRPKWARPVRDIAAEVCRENGWIYSRGDEAEAQRIIHGIWSEIACSSAVLIDITGHNPNVALELGLVHALGPPYRIVAQGFAEKHMFMSLEKVQIHSYGRGPGYKGFAKTAAGLLESAIRKA